MDLDLGIISESEKRLKKKLILDYIYTNLKHHNFWAYRYFFCEFLGNVEGISWQCQRKSLLVLGKISLALLLVSQEKFQTKQTNTTPKCLDILRLSEKPFRNSNTFQEFPRHF